MANKKIQDIEGIGPVIGEKLKAVGVSNSDILLKETRTPAQRKALAAKAGLTEKQILKFANMVDLFRINGVGSEYAELLEAAGVDTVPELARRRADNLTVAMAEVNDTKKLVRRVPSEADVVKWIDQAKELPRMLEY